MTLADDTPSPPRSRRFTRRRVALGIAALVVVVALAALWQRANPYTIETAIDIDAPPAVVWEVLTDFDAYPAWNPVLVGMTGDLSPGGTLTFSTDDTDDALTFSPVVLDVEPEALLRWEGSLLVTGIFDGEHVFTLEPREDGGTRLVQYENFRGITVVFLTGWLDENTRPDFLAMNEALRERSEALVLDTDREP